MARSIPKICYATAMRYLHTMIRVRDLPAALRFFCEGLGLREVRRRDHEQGRFTLVFLGEKAEGDSPQIELTHNWDQQDAVHAAAATSATSRTRSTTSTPRASASSISATRSRGRRATAAWRSSARRT